MDWLVVWGVTQAVELAFKPILEELATEATKDWVKDFFKDCLKNVIRLPSKGHLDISAGKALKEFLQLVQKELKDADLDEQELHKYIKPLKQFIKNKSVKETLGSAFQEDCKVIDTEILAKTWKNLQLLSLPDEFDWEFVGKQYKREVKKIIRNSDELRKILDSQTLGEIEQHAKEFAGIAPDFDLINYREGIQERYANLKLESLDTSGYAYRYLNNWYKQNKIYCF